MIIDVSERIETAKRITAEWAERAGYKQPEVVDTKLSKKARDLQRVMNLSEFGCQQRNVHSILQILVGEKFPINEGRQLSEYANQVPMVVGAVLVPVGHHEGRRAGLVTRISQSGNAGIRLSNGELHNNHLRQEHVRPATDEEIDQYFSEMFGLSVNEADNPPVIEDEEIPF